LIKIIRCTANSDIQRCFLRFMEERKIPRLRIVNPDYFYDVVIQRLEPTPPAKSYSPWLADMSREVPLV
jgi:hypothetical protein